MFIPTTNSSSLPAARGIPALAWAGLGVTAAMVIALILLWSLYPVMASRQSEPAVEEAPSSPASFYSPWEVDSDLDVSEVATPPAVFDALPDVKVCSTFDVDEEECDFGFTTPAAVKDVSSSFIRPGRDILSSPSLDAALDTAMFFYPLVTSPSTVEGPLDARSEVIVAPHTIDAPLLLLTSPTLPDFIAPELFPSHPDDAFLSHAFARRSRQVHIEDLPAVPRAPQGWLEEMCAQFMFEEADRLVEREDEVPTLPSYSGPVRPARTISSSPSLEEALSIATLAYPVVTPPPTVVNAEVTERTSILVDPHAIDAPLLMITSPTLPDVSMAEDIHIHIDYAYLSDVDAKDAAKADRRRRRQQAKLEREERRGRSIHRRVAQRNFFEE